jgi:hypothetical protein
VALKKWIRCRGATYSACKNEAKFLKNNIRPVCEQCAPSIAETGVTLRYLTEADLDEYGAM